MRRASRPTVLATATLACGALAAASFAALPAAAAETVLCEKYEYAFVSDERFVVSNQVWGADTPSA